MNVFFEHPIHLDLNIQIQAGHSFEPRKYVPVRVKVAHFSVLECVSNVWEAHKPAC
jgi:hypothetical protein